LVHLGAHEIPYRFEIVDRILLAEGGAFSPRGLGLACLVAFIAFAIAFMFELPKVFLHLLFFFSEVVLHLCQIANPFLFDRVIIASESPCDFISLFFWFEL
jgi:hypothetical protein